MRALGKHILVELYECDRSILNSHKIVEEIMVAAGVPAEAILTSCQGLSDRLPAHPYLLAQLGRGHPGVGEDRRQPIGHRATS